MIPYKKAIVGTGLLAFLLSGIAATKPPEDDEGHYTNLKVLSKKISEDELERVMYSFEHQLGVTCLYCHVKKTNEQGIDFASDAKKEKLVARDMIKMTININKKYFNTKIDKKINERPIIWCRTCHKGFTKPPTVSNKKMND